MTHITYKSSGKRQTIQWKNRQRIQVSNLQMRKPDWPINREDVDLTIIMEVATKISVS